MEHLPDHELLVLARRDASAFDAFYRRHVEAVFSFFRRRTQAVEVAYDLTAETFAGALAAVPRYHPGPAPAEAWLWAIARNTLAASRRRGQVEDRARRALAMEPVVLDDDAATWLEELSESPALAALEELPADQRGAIVARHLHDASYVDIAKDLGCSESVVRQRVSRGLRSLQARLEETHHD